VGKVYFPGGVLERPIGGPLGEPPRVTSISGRGGGWDDVDGDALMDDVIVVDGLGSGSWRCAGFSVAVQPVAHQADDLAGIIGVGLDVHVGEKNYTYSVKYHFQSSVDLMLTKIRERNGILRFPSQD
jgi:hypothetical protein